MNPYAIRSIYFFEMHRTFRTIWQSIVSPVVSTSLYFIVFGAGLGHYMPKIDQAHYGAFIVPGLMMTTLLTLSIANASFGIYFPKFTGTIYEVLSAPVSAFEIVVAYVGAAATKSIIVALIILATAAVLTPLEIRHPLWMVGFLILTAFTFSLFGFMIGIWADGFEKLQMIPLLVVTPLSMLGGSFYKISMLPGIWKRVALFDPVVYLISGFRWAFFGAGDVAVGVSVAATFGFLLVCLTGVWWIFKTGWRLKS